MQGKLLFELPVYRLSKEAFREETDKVLAKRIPESIKDDEALCRELRRMYKHPYHYNEAVGWIQIYADGIQLVAYYYFVVSDRVRRGFKKKYEHRGKAFEMGTFMGQTNEDILAGLFDRISSLSHYEPFKGYVISTDPLKNVGAYVDWKTLINSNKQAQL
ncbi:hypothetical protein [Saccharibacillus deserti]|uniref:hypothetical protein n=1 Tax=Saccharibacillus deserti TaxID=1634444 RepID=UPI0015516954|nr:hypothetical protein [Saccharibacillus deserti]